MPTEPTPERQKPAVRWSGTHLTCSLSSRKLVIARRCRPDLAHLTVSWGHRSGAIDVHLARDHEMAMVDACNKHYEPLLVVSPETQRLAAQVVEMFARQVLLPFALKNLRRYRPGWLTRRGYVVVLAEPTDVRRLVERAAPKAGEKYRLNLGEVSNLAIYAPMVSNNVYSPEILAWPETVSEIVGRPQSEMLATAVRLQSGGPSHRDTITLRYGPDLKGITGWCGMMNHHGTALAARASSSLGSWFALHCDTQHVDVLNRIVAGMALDEIEHLRPGLDRIRATIRASETTSAPHR